MFCMIENYWGLDLMAKDSSPGIDVVEYRVQTELLVWVHLYLCLLTRGSSTLSCACNKLPISEFFPERMRIFRSWGRWNPPKFAWLTPEPGNWLKVSGNWNCDVKSPAPTAVAVAGAAWPGAGGFARFIKCWRYCCETAGGSFRPGKLTFPACWVKYIQYLYYLLLDIKAILHKKNSSMCCFVGFFISVLHIPIRDCFSTVMG